MADEEGNAQLLAQAENSSLSGFSRDFSVLYEARGSGDVVFKFPAEGDELEERAHRCACTHLRSPRAKRVSTAPSALLLTLTRVLATHLRVQADPGRAQQVLCSAYGAYGHFSGRSHHGLFLLHLPARAQMGVHGCVAQRHCAGAAVFAPVRRVAAGRKPATAKP